MRDLTRADISDLAYGAALLGTGGGGSPWIGRLAAEQHLDVGGRITLVDPTEVAPDAGVVTIAMVGAPTVMTEKLLRGDEMAKALDLIAQVTGRRVDAILPVEIGGLNSTIPLVAAGMLGVPVIDADGMARAFPEVQMVSFGIAGIQAAPMILVNEHGDHALLNSDDNRRVERMARAICESLGGVVQAASYMMTGADARDHAIPGTISLAMRLGAAHRRALRDGHDPVEAVLACLDGSGVHGPARRIARGRITDLDRQVRGGFNIGQATIETDIGEPVIIEFRNENLLARQGKRVLAIVPDLVCIVDSETGTPITTEELRYGLRVTVLGIGAPGLFTTAKALSIVGPAGFGIDLPHTPIASAI